MGGRPGAKRKGASGKPLDPINAAAAIRTLALIRKREGWSYAATAQLLAEYETVAQAGAARARLRKEAVFSVDDNTIYRALQKERPPFDAAAKAIYLWMSDRFNDEFQDAHVEEELRQRETLVATLKEALGHGTELNFAKVRSFSGVYRLYRPYHLEPAKGVSVCRFTIGSPDSDFDCAFETRFRDRFGEPRRNTATGKIVPHGPRLFAILSAPGTSRSNFILLFDDLDHQLDQAIVAGMGGLLLAAAGAGSTASAWPVYARRIREGESFEPHFTPASSYRRLPAPVQDRLDRGAIYWRPKDFPAPYRKNKTASGPRK